MSASSNTIGESSAITTDGTSSGGRSMENVRCRSSPGTNVRTSEPGEKPSLRFHSVGSIGLPAWLRGIASGERSTRLPVGVVSSATV